MRLGLLPAFERAARFALHRRGFESRVVATRLGTLHAFDARGDGDLPITIVLHGIGSAATSFAPTLVGLKPHVRRVIAPDLPGHGFSPPVEGPATPGSVFESVKELLDTVVDEPMILVGNSLGGALALHYALDRPSRVRALVLVSPAGARMSQEEWSALLRAFRVASVAEARQLLRRIYARAPWYTTAFAADFHHTLKRPGIRDILDSATLEDLPGPERFRELTMPIMLVWGRSERVLPPSALEYFRLHLPAHTLVEEPVGFGHCPHIDDPIRFARRIVEFARSSLGPAQRTHPLSG